jgi:hypothetical protein
MEQKWLNVLRTQTHLFSKGTFVPSSTRSIKSSTPRFKQAARANRCMKIAIGLYSVGV